MKINILISILTLLFTAIATLYAIFSYHTGKLESKELFNYEENSTTYGKNSPIIDSKGGSVNVSY